MSSEPDNGDKWSSRWQIALYVGTAAASLVYTFYGAWNGDVVWWSRSGGLRHITGPSAWRSVPAVISFWIGVSLLVWGKESAHRYFGYFFIVVFAVLMAAAR